MAGRGCLVTLLVLSVLQRISPDNGVPDGISDICAECIKNVQPFPDKTCITHSTRSTVLLCGAYKMSEEFYLDCSSYIPDLPERWNSWQKCYLDEACGKACVKAYHNHYTDSCAALMPDPNQPLACADYGQIHFGGAISCGKPEDRATDLIKNMTLKCGCETVTGDRKTCLQQMHTESCEGIAVNTFVGVIVGVVVAAIVLIVIVIIVAVCISNKRKRALELSNGDKKAGVISHSFTTNQSTNGFSNNGRTTSESSHKYVLASPTVPASPENSASKRTASEDGAEERVPTMTITYDISSDTGEVVTTSQGKQIETGYVNVQHGLSHDRPASTSSSQNTLDRVRAPIPVPR